MQRLGFAIFVAGVIISSWYAARYIPPATIQGSGKDGAITSMDRLEAWGGVAGAPFAGGALLMMAGGIIARRAMAHKARAGAMGSGEEEDTHAMLAGIEAAIAALPEGDPEQHAQELRKQLDVLLDEMIPEFLDARQRHELHLSVVGYAELSSAFASTERGLARAWSALTDESWAEVPPCIEAAKQSIAQAVGLAAQFGAA